MIVDAVLAADQRGMNFNATIVFNRELSAFCESKNRLDNSCYL